MITPTELYAFLPMAISLTKNEDDAMDLLHDCFVKLSSCEYEEKGRKAGMIRSVINNRFIDLYRRKNSKKRKISAAAFSDRCFQPDYGEKEIEDLRRRIVKQRLEKLSERDQKILRWYLDGVPGKDIAEKLNWNISGVNGVIFRIRNMIVPGRHNSGTRIAS